MTITSNSSAALPQRSDSATLFKRTDANGDGKITKDELTTVLENHAEKSDGSQGGPSVDDLFSKLDADNDGAITEAEHEAGLAQMDGERGQPPPPPESTPGSGRVDTLKKLLEALEKKNASGTTATGETSTTADAASAATGATDDDLSKLIEQLVAELKQNSEDTKILRATA